MFPLKDHVSSGKFPWVNLSLILLTVFAFFQELTTPNLEGFLRQWALVPTLVDFADWPTLLPFLSSIFLHAGWIHLISNMWFLWIFGDNVEAKFGHFPYLIFYLSAGILAGFGQYLVALNSSLPMLGASGAVAGVLGAYLVFFPNHRVDTLLPFFGFPMMIQVPAGFVLIYWFFTQLFSGVASLAVPVAIGGIAWWAHIGGFSFGWLVGVLKK